MDDAIQPKLFVSYAHADGGSTVKEFWTLLRAHLTTPKRQWEKWGDRQILVGEEWNHTIIQALEIGCNCCLLLVSELFAKSLHIRDQEWPKTLENYESRGIVFFPVVFGVLEGGRTGLPDSLNKFQIYWPTVADLYLPPPINVSNPDQVRQCYKDVKETEAARDRFLSGLAKQMNIRFDKFLREQKIKKLSTSPVTLQADTNEFVTDASDEEAFAKAIFGSFSYEKRYRDSSSKNHYFPRQIDTKLDEHLGQSGWVLVEGHPLAGKFSTIHICKSF